MITARIPRRTRVATLSLLLLAAAACGGSADRTSDSAVAVDSVAAATAVAAAPATSAPVPAADSAGGEAMAQGTMLDPNAATRPQLLAVPGMADHVADAVIAGRPFADMVAVNKVLVAHLPDSTARKTVYAHVWKPIDLNTASGDEILLIPGVGRRMRHEFEEYRPYKNIEQFRREIGKYVDKQEVARLERYVTIK